MGHQHSFHSISIRFNPFQSVSIRFILFQFESYVRQGSSVKVKSVIVNMVKSKSSDPDSEKPFQLFYCSPLSPEIQQMTQCQFEEYELGSDASCQCCALLGIDSSDAILPHSPKGSLYQFSDRPQSFQSYIPEEDKLHFCIYRLIPECQKGIAAAGTCNGTPMCKSGTWSIYFRLPQRSQLRPPPLT